RITGLTPALTEFSVKSVTEGIDAQGEVTIRIEESGRAFLGKASDTDIIVSSARAYLNALNRMIAARQ
ncbi:MAG TPA: alpha-isopropylmalate synthase regulatory domain-containing protein, partial [Leptospiraceae bacterium]|nr:alpha-isopropylmalate synthase regulatory domain-containing protein [Leptospiraceae bacterium]